MGKLKHRDNVFDSLATDMAKPLIPQKDKFKQPPKKKFRLKLRFSHVKTEPKIKIERESKPIIPHKTNHSVETINIKQEPLVKKEDETWNLPQIHTEDFTDPTYSPNSDEFSLPSSDDDSAYFEKNTFFSNHFLAEEEVLQVQKVNTRKPKRKNSAKKTKPKKTKVKKQRRRYKRRVLSDKEKLQASRRRRTCLVKKPKSEYLGVSWCNTKNTWVARVWHPTERKLIWAGYHQNEKSCALAVNEKCLDLQIPLKNPQVLPHMLEL